MGGEAVLRAGRSRHRGLVWAALPVAAVLTLTGCGPDPATPGTGGRSGATDGRSGATDGASGASDAFDGMGRATPSTGKPADALAKWRAFPVDADPRPLILTNGAVLDPATGFLTGEDKLAYLAGDFELATTVPFAPATSAGYPIVSAQAALERLRATGGSTPASRPLRIVKIALVQAVFGTDRGPLGLPAWRFELDQVTDPVQVLAVDPKRLWRGTVWGSTGMDHRASLSADGRSVTFSFYGSPAGPSPCGADYTADVAESRTAVVVTPREITPNPQGTRSTRMCTTIAALRTVTVPLAAPLGARVLLMPDGSPVPVTSH